MDVKQRHENSRWGHQTQYLEFRHQETLGALKAVGHLYANTPNFNAVGNRLRVVWGMVPWQKRHSKGYVYWMNVAVFSKLVLDADFESEEFKSLDYRRGKSFAAFFDSLAQKWPALFALSFFIRSRSRI